MGLGKLALLLGHLRRVLRDQVPVGKLLRVQAPGLQAQQRAQHKHGDGKRAGQHAAPSYHAASSACLLRHASAARVAVKSWGFAVMPCLRM